MDTDAIERLAAACKERRNVRTPALAGWKSAGKGFYMADAEAENLAQNLIDLVADHRALREARIWMLFREGVKPDADGLIEMGRARRVSPLVKALALRSEETGGAPDFVITLNAREWAKLATTERLALLDHQLSHCAATIAGRFVPRAQVQAFVAALAADHVETCEDLLDEDKRILVRYLRRPGPIKAGKVGYGKQALSWRTRKHQVEDFPQVIERWGPWTPQLRHLVDILERAEDSLPLLDGAAQAAKGRAGKPPRAAGARRRATAGKGA